MFSCIVNKYMTSNCHSKNRKTALYRKPSDLKRFSFVYCNRNCQKQAHIKDSKSKNVQCSFCKNEIRKTVSQLKKSKTGLHFCNNKCKNTYLSRFSRWSGNPYDNRSRRKKVFEAANNECQNCGPVENVKMLDIHHDNGNHHDNDWSNLRSVCVWCHQLHHRCGFELKLKKLFDKEGNRV